MDTVDLLIVRLMESLETGKQVFSENEILHLSQNRSILIRSLTAEVLGNYPIDFSQKILLKLLNDPNKSVRSSAAIGLVNFSFAYEKK